jgi:hypothetical protein
MKARRYAKLTDVEVMIRPTPASVRRILAAIAEEARWNSLNAEEEGSPQQKDQAAIADTLTQAVQDIYEASTKHWSEG